MIPDPSQLCRIRPGDSLPGWRTHVPHLLCVWWMCVCMGVRVHVDTGGEHGCPPRWLEVRSDLTEFMFQPHCLVSQPLGTTYIACVCPPPRPPPPSALRVRTHITIASFLIRCWGSKSDHLPVQQTVTEPVPQPPSPPPRTSLLLRQSYSIVQVGLELCGGKLALNLRPFYLNGLSAEITGVRHQTT